LWVIFCDFFQIFPILRNITTYKASATIALRKAAVNALSVYNCYEKNTLNVPLLRVGHCPDAATQTNAAAHAREL
jgi:hypothetical protein